MKQLSLSVLLAFCLLALHGLQSGCSGATDGPTPRPRPDALQSDSPLVEYLNTPCHYDSQCRALLNIHFADLDTGDRKPFCQRRGFNADRNNHPTCALKPE